LTGAIQLDMSEPTIAITATFTAEPISEYLAFWVHTLGLSARVAFAPYNQVFQQLLDPTSLLAKNTEGLNVVMVRLEDWLPLEKTRAEFEQTTSEFVVALQTAATRSKTPYLACICPPSPMVVANPESSAILQAAEEHIAMQLADIPTIFLAKSVDILETYPVGDYHDPHGEELGRIPYTAEFFAALGTFVARKFCTLHFPPFKVIAVDCDQTLWEGVCGEVGPMRVRIDPGRRALQEFLVAQQEAGMLLCLCSKNVEEDVFAVFTQRDDMVLKKEHFVAHRINWQPKSQNLISLAEELQLGLDSFIFIDDNPLECAGVRANCPQVLTLQLPSDSQDIPRFLRHVWAFDRRTVTEEDRKRTMLYRQNIERERLRREALTLEDFLAGLHLQIRIAEMAPVHLPRVAQLTQRTNQFNFTTIRRNEAELQALIESGSLHCLITEVCDRFGDYGLVGVMLYRFEPEFLSVDTFLLSCRVLGRGVEHGMLSHLIEIAREQKLGLAVPFYPTSRNQPARDFLEKMLAAYHQPEGEGWIYRIPAEEVATLRIEPTFSEPPALIEPEKKIVDTSPDAIRPPTEVFQRIATEWWSPASILEVVATAKRRARPEPNRACIMPRTPLEECIAQIWSEVLGVEKVGIRDNFFELGGDSLLATQVCSRLRKQFQIALPLRILFETPTVEELAIDIFHHLTTQTQHEEVAHLLEEVESHSG